MTLQKSYDAAKAIQAVKELQAEALANGTSNMTLEEINAEIAAYRKERKTKAE